MTADTQTPERKEFLRIENIQKHYGSVKAVDGIDLTVRQGEFLTLLGPSGSGKTTLLMMIAGFVFPDHGRIVLADRELTRIPPYNRGLGMVFQSYTLFPHMTVFNNVAFPLKMQRCPSEEILQRVNEALAMVHLEGLTTRMPSQLSGGQQQRVSLARALVHRPQLLLMDEPLGALDKKLRGTMQIELKHIQQQVGITVVFVTHDQEEALTMSDRVAVMRDGRLEQVGSAHDLYERPTNRFVADFVGETNFLEVTLDESGTVRTTSGDAIQLPAGSLREDRGPVLLSIRPEKIFFQDASCRDDACAHGRVTEILYMGDITKYLINLGSEASVVVKQHNRQGIRQPAVGDAVVIAWHRENCVVLPP